MRLKSLTIVISAFITVLTLAVTFYNIQTGRGEYPAWFMPFGIAMVLFIPGYAVTLAILPEVDRATILLLSLGLSICLDVAGGFVLNYSPWGLHPFSWAVWLSGISLPTWIIAAYRRSTVPSAITSRSLTPKWDWKVVTSFSLTGILFIAAVLIARYAAEHTQTTFTQLWAIPGKDGKGYVIQVGISNRELESIHYDLYVESRGITINHWVDIVLAPNETWTVSMPLMEKPQYPITFQLYKQDSLTEAYRMVHLVPASFDGREPTLVAP